MKRIPRVAAMLAVSGGLTLAASAQTPPAPAQGEPNSPLAIAAQHQQSMLKRTSLVHHYPYPYPGYYHGDDSAGFRNPGGMGRYLEYYPPGNQFQERGDPVRPAVFDQGGGHPTLADQRAAQQLGVSKSNSIMNQIDTFARPYGYGFGVGYFGGFY
jgi:hypothetical protein